MIRRTAKTRRSSSSDAGAGDCPEIYLADSASILSTAGAAESGRFHDLRPGRGTRCGKGAGISARALLPGRLCGEDDNVVRSPASGTGRAAAPVGSGAATSEASSISSGDLVRGGTRCPFVSGGDRAAPGTTGPMIGLPASLGTHRASWLGATPRRSVAGLTTSVTAAGLDLTQAPLLDVSGGQAAVTAQGPALEQDDPRLRYTQPLSACLRRRSCGCSGGLHPYRPDKSVLADLSYSDVVGSHLFAEFSDPLRN